jgi:small subunit ribosomal protein S15
MVNRLSDEAQALLEKFRMHQSDTGSTMCQIIRLTHRIEDISSNHSSKHKKDHRAKRAIVQWVAQRRRLQKYLARECKHDISSYNALMSSLGLRGK